MTPTTLSLPNDVVRYIEKHFPAELRDEATSILLSAKLETNEFPSPRLLRCALFASEGKIDQLRRCVALLAIDWRDVIMAAEYEMQSGKSLQVRDFAEFIR